MEGMPTPPGNVTALAEQIRHDGGEALAVYPDPVGGHWHVFALLPIEKVEATPYQRDLSRARVKRLQEVVKRLDRFVDPIVAVSTAPGPLLDAERQSPPRGAVEAAREADPGDRRPRR